MSPTIVLITGANRGLGKGLLERYLALPNHLVIAANRDPLHESSKRLADLPKGSGSSLIVVKIDASIEQDVFDAIRELQHKHGIQHIDIVIANAGVSYVWPTVADLKISDLKAHIEPNVYGCISIYQASRPLLQKSKNPIFSPMGSTAGAIANQIPIKNAAYGPSKAAVNWLTVRINAEDDWLNAIVMAPGWVATDLGYEGAKGLGFDDDFINQNLISTDISCDGMMKVYADSFKERHGGKMIMYDGSIGGW
ncbi:uncharacterized protein EAE97_006638 [Botrytis byssoidea]|uniref:Aflatoxin biosynthesis ketoreductase nor-1 n=1 Tax=Botrytis byssoidea TaxID=139641 RepID=A0A9P5IPK3_9HELO|nr:uncharacterized protein EAE97_006638 [Botrytis byssoidea]KAF7941801.1 hypothetical protein EAE97_006638 [Botrytis byssoidea]